MLKHKSKLTNPNLTKIAEIAEAFICCLLYSHKGTYLYLQLLKSCDLTTTDQTEIQKSQVVSS